MMEDATMYLDIPAATPATSEHIGAAKGSKKHKNANNTNIPKNSSPAQAVDPIPSEAPVAPLGSPMGATPASTPLRMPAAVESTPSKDTGLAGGAQPLLEGLSALMDDVPELINSSAAVSADLAKFLPVGQLPTAAIVAVIAGLAAYLALRKVDQ